MHIESRSNFDQASLCYYKAGFGVYDRSRQENVLIKPSPRILWESVLGTSHRSLEKWHETLPHLKAAIDLKVSGHLLRTGSIAGEFAASLCLSHQEVDRIKLKGLLHDIGKVQKKVVNGSDIFIFAHIINSDRNLSMQERELMNMHSAVGAEMLEDIGLPEDIIYTIKNHHDDNMSDRDTNIISIADVYDATLGKNCFRPYRKGELMERRRIFCEEGERRFGHLPIYRRFRHWEALATSTIYPKGNRY